MTWRGLTSSPPALFLPFFFAAGVTFGSASSALAASTSLPECRYPSKS